MSASKPSLNGRLRRQSGVGLLEVLVTILLLAVGIMGMSKIHSILIRDGGTANNRALAISLAQEKLDDLRSFTNATSIASACPTGVFCYTTIGTNTGGLLVNGSLIFPATNPPSVAPIAIGNGSFTRTWTVTPVYLTTNPQSPTPDYQQVTVTVTWMDPNCPTTPSPIPAGYVCSVSLSSAIYGDDPTITAFGAKGSSVAGSPKINYTPQAAPNVVPISIGGGVSRETSKPLPDVSNNGISVATQFTSVNYNATNKQQTQEDFKTVSCLCQYPGTSTTGYTPAYYTYDTASQSLVVKYPTAPVTKTTGSVVVYNGTNAQDPLCTSCCNDHHDSTGSAVKFNPDRPSSEYDSNGDNYHYNFSNASNHAAGLTRILSNSSDQYLDSCRFLRVDGIYRIMQDWRLSAVMTMPYLNYLTNSSTLSAYQTWVSSQVEWQAKTDGGANPSNVTALSVTGLTNPSNGTQLMARSVYVDRVYTASGALDSNYYGNVNSGTIGLSAIPFNEVNTTLLASWDTSNSAVARVTANPVLDIASPDSNYYGTYSRGQISTVGNGTATISAYMLPGNSGLTAGSDRSTYASVADYPDKIYTASPGTINHNSEVGINPYDQSSSTIKSSFITVTNTANPLTYTVYLQKGNVSADLTRVTVSDDKNGTCSQTNIGNQTTFVCTYTGSLPTTVTIQTAQTGGFLPIPSTGTASTYGTTTSCAPSSCGTSTDPIKVYGPQLQIGGTCVSGCTGSMSTISITATGSVTCTASSAPSCLVSVTSTSPTWSGSITLSDSKNGAKVYISGSSITNCPNSNNQGPVSTSITAVGPGDAPSKFWMCD